MRTDLFDFVLPDSSIALHPAEPRDSARLLVVHPVKGACALDDADLEDRIVRDLPSLLRPGDALVFNDTKVIPAALSGVRVRSETRAKVDFNLTKRVSENTWRAFARPAKRLEAGDRVHFGHSEDTCLLGALDATVVTKGEAGEVELAFDLSGAALDEAIAAIGLMPLPPYIALKREPDARDRETYQTIYASRDGAVAAPTAGLHFTPELFAALDARGVSRHFVTLHVGAGTFLPVKVDDTDAHTMHSEWGEVSADTAAALNE
ncbi:MAG: S-adenosylmethionine:tRNA ribosyltransferase-isomerase, partial [Hyphomicrobium sp.]